MNRGAWSEPVSMRDAHRRAAGRNRINRWRRVCAEIQMFQAGAMMDALGTGHGVQSKIARQLGVHRGTVSRYHAQLTRLALRPDDRSDRLHRLLGLRERLLRRQQDRAARYRGE